MPERDLAFPFRSSPPIGSNTTASAALRLVSLADEHGPGIRRPLETRREIDRVAGHPSGVGSALGGHHLPGVDSHPQPQTGIPVVACKPQPRTEELDRPDQRQPRPDCPLRVIVARPRDAEHRHGGVADELFQLPSVASHRLADRGEVRVLDRGHVLWIQLLRQAGEPDKIGEQDGDDPPLESGFLGEVGHARTIPTATR